MPAIPSISVWPAIAMAIRRRRSRRAGRPAGRPSGPWAETAEPADEIVLPAEPAAPQIGATQTILDQLAAAPEERGDLRRSA